MTPVLQRIWAAWTVIDRRIGQGQAWLIFNVIYSLILGLVAIGARLLSFDPFRRRVRDASCWVVPTLVASSTLDAASKQ